MSITTSTTTTDQIAAAAPLPAGTWQVDPAHSRVGFTARHMMISKVRGEFSEFSADIRVAETARDSSLSAEVQMASIEAATFAVMGTHSIGPDEIAEHGAEYRRVIEALRDGRLDLEALSEMPRLNMDLDAVILS